MNVASPSQACSVTPNLAIGCLTVYFVRALDNSQGDALVWHDCTAVKGPTSRSSIRLGAG